MASWAASLRQYRPHSPPPASDLPTGQAFGNTLGSSRGFEYVRDPDPREELGLQPSLLKSFSRVIDEENDTNAARMRALGLPQALSTPNSLASTMVRSPTGRFGCTSPSSPAAAGPVLSDEDYNREADRLAKTVEELRSRHASFEPQSPQAKARAKSSSELGSKRGNQRLTDEEFHERVQAWKYARRIEPELPPLPTLESLGPPPPQAKDKIREKSASGTLDMHRPQERLELLASRAADLRERHVHVAEQRRERKAARLVALKDAVRKNPGLPLGGKVRDEAGIFQGLGGRKNTWLVALAAGSFAHCLKEELQFSKMRCRDQHQYLTTRASEIEGGSIFLGPAKKSVIEIREKLCDQKLAPKLMMLSCMLARSRRVKERTAAIEVITPVLQVWTKLGAVFIAMKRVALSIKKIQRQWRIWRVKLQKILKEVTTRWLPLERQVVVAEIRAEQNRSKAKEVLSYENLIALKRVEDDVREHFLINELRARRYNLLPKLFLWSEEYGRWNTACREHRTLQECVKFVGGDAGEAMPMFLFPPPEPRYTPVDADIHDMLFRARRGPDKHLPIPKDRAAAWIIRRKQQEQEVAGP